MSTTKAELHRELSQTITVTAIPPGALEYISARISRHGGSVHVWEFPGRGVTEVGFTHSGDGKKQAACQSMVADWCAANFPGVILMGDVPGKHRRSGDASHNLGD